MDTHRFEALSESPRPERKAAAKPRVGAGFRHVLACLDGSLAAEAALALAAHIARTDAAELTLLQVLEAPPDRHAIRATDVIEWDLARRETEAYLERLAAGVRDQIPEPRVMVAEGEAAPRVASLHAELGSDLIALSTHGEGGSDAWMLGSTAHKILDIARSAVLVVPARALDGAPHVPFRRIFVPLDGSVRSQAVLPTAVRLARGDDAEIVLAHVVVEPIATDVLSTPEDLALAHELADRMGVRARAYLDQIRSALESSQARVKTIAGRAADVRAELVAMADREQTDLVVLSAHGATCNAQRRFGSVAASFVARSRVPVLVMQDLPAVPKKAPVRTRAPSRASGGPVSDR